MAIHTALPIYKVTYDLALLAATLTRNMPRDIKGLYGRQLSEECASLVLFVYRANSARDKVPYLDTLLERLQVTELLFRLCQDLHAISRAQYARAIELTSSIGKQANGWRKHSASSPAA